MSISCSCTSQIKSVGQPNHRQLLALILSWPARAWVANKKWAGLLPNEKYSEKAVCQRHGSANVKTFLLLPNEKYSVAATDSAVPKKRTILVFSSCFPVAHWLPFLGELPWSVWEGTVSRTPCRLSKRLICHHLSCRISVWFYNVPIHLGLLTFLHVTPVNKKQTAKITILPGWG